MRSFRDELIDLVDSGVAVDYTFFWGHDRLSQKSCLSQWYEAPFMVDNKVFKTAEHYMMWRKARMFDEEAAYDVLVAPTPREAKAIGRKVRNFDDSAWDAVKFDVVVQGNIAKFSTHAVLRDFLVGTGDSVLVEASPYDRVYGIGMDARDKRALDPRKWNGENLLGFALMTTRQILAGNLA